ncbi:MAG TPA: glutamate synthase [Thiotrichales bacterium]|nr:glutamate synthase [Thiotrichales bacterium]
MNISGIVVRARPDRLDQVRARLEALEGVEVHAANEEGKLVVTVEAEGERQLADRVVGIESVPGVLAASLVYHQHEDDEKLDEIVEQEAEQ